MSITTFIRPKTIPIFIVLVFDLSKCKDSMWTGKGMEDEARKGLFPIGHEHKEEMAENNNKKDNQYISLKISFFRSDIW